MLVSMVFAQDEFMDTFDEIDDNLKQQGREWVKTGEAATGTFEILGGDCDDPFVQEGLTGIYSIDLFMITGIVMVIVAFALVILYLIGVLIQSDNLIIMVKDQVFPLLHTLLIMGAIMGSILGANMWYGVRLDDPNLDDTRECNIYSHAKSQGEDLLYIDAAMSFSRCMTFNMISDFSFLLLYNTVIHTLYSSTMWIGLTWRAMYSFSLGPVLKPLIDLIGTTMQFLSLAIGEWILHVITLCVIKKWTYGIFIPLSILLRTIPQTKDAGNAMLALFFALSLVYPMMFILDYEVFRVTSASLLTNESIVRSFFEEGGIIKVGGIFVISLFLMAGVLMPLFLTWAISVGFELVSNSIYYIVIMGLLLPFINIFVTLTAAKETARFLGTQVNFMSFLRLI